VTEVLRFAYADPPYPGQSKRHYRDHPDYDGEVDHQALLTRLQTDFDGWVLHTSSPALGEVMEYALAVAAGEFRVMAWVKPFAAFKSNVPVACAWEPVLVKPVRKPTVEGRMVVMRDWVSEPITMLRGLAGAKPERVCHWAFEVAGANPRDLFTDLYPGTGAVTRAWGTWCASRQLELAPGAIA